MIRDDIKAATIASMKAHDSARTATLRMVSSAIKNKDIELRVGTAPANDDAMVADVLAKMIKQRRESIEMFTKGNRPELAAAEAAEVAVIESFLPQQMSDAEAQAAVAALVAELGASSAKDMGRVMGELKTRYAGQLDMGKAGGMVKAALAG
jgi:uncharacterized protein YqeY